MGQEAMRRGLWSEQEDLQLVYYVKLFGDRRWDFISKVSGLKRTGKSCRLRWVNYLDPGLKRGKLTPSEEKLVLQLHSKWGNSIRHDDYCRRWSKIATKLPGRTDNEIKNFWRTYMRHKAQEKKNKISPQNSSLSISFSSSSTSESKNPLSAEANSSSSHSKNDSFPVVDSVSCLKTTETASSYDTGGFESISSTQRGEGNEKDIYSMDDIWSDIDKPRENICNLFDSRLDSPIWNYCPDIPWIMEGGENEVSPMITDEIFGGYDQVNSSLIG